MSSSLILSFVFLPSDASSRGYRCMSYLFGRAKDTIDDPIASLQGRLIFRLFFTTSLLLDIFTAVTRMSV
jgi:hypothetical protein